VLRMLEQYIGPTFLPNAFPNQAITGTFPMPATYGIGVSTTHFRGMRLSADVRMQDYKKFQNIPLNFSINEDTPDLKNIALPATKYLNFNFRESWNFAFGVEKQLSPTMTIRAGYLFDLSPVPDQSVGPLFPDSDRDSFTIGASKKVADKEFTFFYEAMNFRDRVTNVPANNYQWTNGAYNNFAHVVGLALRINKESH